MIFRVFCLNICSLLFYSIAFLFPPFSLQTLDIFLIYHGSELYVHNYIKDKSVKAFMKIKLYGNLFLCGFSSSVDQRLPVTPVSLVASVRTKHHRNPSGWYM